MEHQMKFKLIKMFTAVFFLLSAMGSSVVSASIITIEVDSIIESNYTLLADASTFTKAGGVYKEFAIGDIFTTKYLFDMSSETSCSGANLITCQFFTGAFVEFSGKPNNSGVFDYALLNSSFQPNFNQDNSPFMVDDFNWNHTKPSSTAFLSGYTYNNVMTNFGGSGLDLSKIHTGVNSLGSMFNKVNLDTSIWANGVGINFYDDNNEIGIIGTSTLGNLRLNTINDVPEPSTLAIFALGIIALISRRFKK